MRYFLIYLVIIFTGLFSAVMIKKNRNPGQDLRPVLRVFGQSSFIKAWGPGPWLKEKFESSCNCRIEFHEMPDSISLIQRVKSEPQNRAADLVFGFDQYDLELAQQGIDWRPIKVDAQSFEPEVRQVLSRSGFVPYDWGVLAFLGRKSELSKMPESLDDLLTEELRNEISLQDPRTSTPGLQFLLWLIQAKGEEKAFEFIQKLLPQAKVWAANWSTSYGLFQKGQAKMTLSYFTSPIASLKEDPQSQVIALPFKEGHPIQFEFMGIPKTCQNCDLAEKFVNLVLSPEGQKVIMDKNYMFPVIKGVRKGTLFEVIPEFKTLDMTILPNQNEKERLLKKWSQLRRAN